MARGGLVVFSLVLIVFFCVGSEWAQAQPRTDSEYHLGAGDVLQLNVLQRPELDRTLTIRADGTAIIPHIGLLPVAGLTPAEAEELIRQRLHLYDPNLGDISVTVTDYNALRIFVLGAVVNPGSYTFTTTPTIWDVIRAAGGPSEGANLRIARVIRQRDGAAHTETHDLSPLLSGSGTLPDIQLNPGDTLVILPSDGVALVPADIGVQVFGSVGIPGTVAISEPTRLVTVLMQAGTPLEDGDLEHVWWVHREDQSQYRSTRVNVRLFLEEGSLAGNPLIYPGDTIRLPGHRRGWIRENLPMFLSSLTATAAILLAIDRLNP
jgi:protein involved in polysaccharide export with SLBB domain